MAGGQPVSMANVRELRALCDRYGIRIYLDATRMVENAFFIQEREEGYADKSIADILKEFCSYTDGAWMSAKKDNLVNIGGWLAVNDEDVFEAARNMVVVYEGLHTYGGMAGRDMEALAIGIENRCRMTTCAPACGQVRYLGDLLIGWDIPIVQPVAATPSSSMRSASIRTSRRISFPAQTLAAELYLDSGVRSMERGVVSAGRDPETGDHRYPALELTRLTIPRRVYTQAHMDVVAESVKAVFDRRSETSGLKMVYEPKYLRFLPGAVRAYRVSQRSGQKKASPQRYNGAVTVMRVIRAERGSLMADSNTQRPLADAIRPRVAGRFRGPGASRWPGPTAGAGDCRQPRILDDLLGAARRGQNHAGADSRPANRTALPRTVGGIGWKRRDPRHCRRRQERARRGTRPARSVQHRCTRSAAGPTAHAGAVPG